MFTTAAEKCETDEGTVTVGLAPGTKQRVGPASIRKSNP